MNTDFERFMDNVTMPDGDSGCRKGMEKITEDMFYQKNKSKK